LGINHVSNDCHRKDHECHHLMMKFHCVNILMQYINNACQDIVARVYNVPN
jgi:hypothetical protein